MTTSQDDRLRLDDDGRGLWLGARHIPWATTATDDIVLESGYQFFSRQALVPFENGLQLSIVWGSCTYSDNHDHYGHGSAPFVHEPVEVEVAVIGDDGLLDLPGGDTVRGYVPVADVRELVDRVADLPSKTITLGG